MTADLAVISLREGSPANPANAVELNSTTHITIDKGTYGLNFDTIKRPFPIIVTSI
jgi:hypothetical protein